MNKLPPPVKNQIINYKDAIIAEFGQEIYDKITGEGFSNGKFRGLLADIIIKAKAQENKAVATAQEEK